jgi:hypothetical protein
MQKEIHILIPKKNHFRKKSLLKIVGHNFQTQKLTNTCTLNTYKFLIEGIKKKDKIVFILCRLNSTIEFGCQVLNSRCATCRPLMWGGVSFSHPIDMDLWRASLLQIFLFPNVGILRFCASLVSHHPKVNIYTSSLLIAQR